MGILDTQIFKDNISEFGETVTLIAVTDTTYSKHGDAIESTSNTTGIKAIVTNITPEEVKESEGILTMNDKIFFFDSTQSNISNGNRILHNSITYEIISVKKRELGGLDFLFEVIGRKT